MRGQAGAARALGSVRWPVLSSLLLLQVCMRYGAYICDQTGMDVCSIECKEAHLAAHAAAPAVPEAAAAVSAAELGVEEEDDETAAAAAAPIYSPYSFRPAMPAFAAEERPPPFPHPRWCAYREHAEVAALPAADVQAVLEEAQVRV